MAKTLAANINATQNVVTLTEALAANPGDLFRLGDEVVQFGAYGRMASNPRLVDHSGKIISLARGASGTTAASHTAGTALLVVADGLVSAVSSPDPFVSGGGVQTVSLLGPFTVSWNTPGLVDPEGDAVPTLVVPAGSLYRPIALLAQTWVGPAQFVITAGVAGPNIAGYRADGSDVGQELYVDAAVSAGWIGPGDAGQLALDIPRFQLATIEVTLGAAVFTIGETPPSAGSIDIYALIATPAA